MVAITDRRPVRRLSLPRLLLVLPLASTLLISGCMWERAKFRQTTNVTAPHVASSGLKVRTRNGSVQVHKAPTADGQVSIAATLYMVSPERLSQATIVANRSSAGVLEISAKPPEGGWRSSEGCSFEIVVPDAAGVELSTGNGALEIEGLSGSAKLDTSNGAITVRDHDGPVVAETSNGRIEATDVGGSIDARTSNGSVTVRLGDRSVGPAKIRTSNGSVTVELSAAFRGALDVSTSNGSVRMPSSAPAGVDKFTSRANRRSAHLQVGDGGPASSIDTSNGSVTVKFRGE